MSDEGESEPAAGRERSEMEVLAEYEDRNGSEHTVVLVRMVGASLVIDTAGRETPRVVVELEAGEGTEQALAVLFGDGGYVERAKEARGPLCRALGPGELQEALAAERRLAA